MRVRTIAKLVLLPAALAVAAVVAVLATRDVSSYRPLVAEKVKAVTGRDFEIGTLKLSIGLVPAIVAEDVKLQNALFGTRAEMIKARRLEAEVALLPLLFGELEIRRLALIGPDILLETDEKGRGNWDFSRDDEPVASARPATAEQAALELPSLAMVTIENGLLTFRDGRSGKITKLELMRLVGSSASRHAPLEIEIAAAYDGVPFHLAGQLGAFTALGSPGPFPLDLTGELAELRIAVKGTVNRPLAPSSTDLSIDISGSSLKELSSNFKIPLPVGPVALSGRIKGAGGRYALTGLAGKLGTSDIAGSADLERLKERWAVEASLTSGQIDLADFRAVPLPENGAKAKLKPKAAANDGRLVGAEPLPLGLLATLDGQLDATIDRLVLGRASLEQAALSASLRHGRLTLDPLIGTLADGALRATLAVDAAQGGAAKLAFHVKKLDINKFAQVIDADDVLSGSMDVSAHLAGRGPSLRAMAASLDGQASVIMGKGQVKSGYVDLLGADLLRLAASAGSGRETTAVNCLVGRFDIARGLAVSRDILFDTEAMTVLGEGTVNLASERLALRFNPRPKDASLINLATPWRVEGSLTAPTVALDEVGLATRAAGALLSVVNPLALLVPMVSAGTADKNPCLAALEPKQARAPAPKKEAGGIRGLIDGVIPAR